MSTMSGRLGLYPVLLVAIICILSVTAQVTDEACYDTWKRCIDGDLNSQASPHMCDLVFKVFGKCAKPLTCQDDLVSQFDQLLESFACSDIVENSITADEDPCFNNPCLNNGSCMREGSTYTCYCIMNYTGQNCEIPPPVTFGSDKTTTTAYPDKCYGNPCLYGGTCINLQNGDFHCNCLPEYYGKMCEFENALDFPCNGIYCRNGGSCINSACRCLDGYEGKSCELMSTTVTQPNQGSHTCDNITCYNNGSCFMASGNAYCYCFGKYTGMYCETIVETTTNYPSTQSTTNGNKMDCYGMTCYNGASCFINSAGPICLCVGQYTGKSCDTPISTTPPTAPPECNNYQCYNGGSCFVLVGLPTCNCSPGFTGMNCLTRLTTITTSGPGTYCNGSYCQNGGSCWSSPNRDYCHCGPDYYGEWCQYYKLSSTTPGPNIYCNGGYCQNGGTCLATASSKSCYCTPGYTGQWCDWYNTSSNGNVTSNPNQCNGGYCQNGGTCQGSPNGDYCSCQPGYKGQWCELQITLSTTPGPGYFCNGGYCRNGASCWGSPSGDYCDCGPRYTGKWCESVMCNGGVCYNDGWCMSSTNGEYCTCQYGYTGAYCETMTETSQDNSCSQRIYECSKILANYGSQAMLNPDIYCRVTKEFMNCYYNVSDNCTLDETVVSAFNQSQQTYDQLCYDQDTSCLNQFLQCGNLSLQSTQYASLNDKMLFCSYTRRAIDCFEELDANDNCTLPDITSQMRTSYQAVCPSDNSSSCPPGVPVVSCFIDPCLLASCPGHPNARCRAKYCGVCGHDYYDEYNRMVNCNNATTIQDQKLQCAERILQCASNLTSNYSGNNFLNPDNYCKLAKESLDCSEQVLRECSNVMNMTSELQQSREMYQQNCKDGVSSPCLQEMLRCSNYSVEATTLITTSGITNMTSYCSLMNDYIRCVDHLRNCSNFTSAMEQAKSSLQSLCGQVMDPCMSNPCSNGGSCFNDMTSTRGYTCQCYEGRYGDNCQARLCDYFTSDPCGPYGKCLGRIETGDMCTCPLKREGIFCEVNDYESVYGECPKRRRLIKYIMEILDGKTPTPYQLNMSVSHILRDINVSWLQMPNCTDRGTYSPVMMEFNVFNLTQKIYYCVNPYGNRLKYSYDSTQQPKCSAVVNGLCNSNPCRNEGVCHMSYDYNNESYWCECKPGFYGSTCEVSVCAGLEIDPCSLNSGVCLGDLETGKFCNCPAGRTGAFCDRSGDDSLLTTCQRLHELSVVAEQYLNGSLTISFFNVGQMIRDMTSKINMKTMWRPSCSETGKPLNVGCTVDILNTTRKLCYCADGHYQPLPNARPSYDGLPNCSRSNELNITTDMKPGMCPPVAPGSVGIGIQECNKDYDCRDNLKCCSNGFGYQCLHPVNQSHTNNSSSCPPGVPVVSCFIDPCLLASCPGHPNARCRAKYCGVCGHDYYDEYNRMVNCNNATTIQDQKLQCAERILQCASNLTSNYSGNNFLNPDNYCKLAKESLDCSEQVLRGECSNVMNMTSELQQSREMYQQNCKDGVSSPCLQEMLRCSNYSVEATTLITTSGITNMTSYCSLMNDYIRCVDHLRNCSNFTSAMEQAKSSLQTLCGQVMDPCMSNPCSNGGSCFNDMTSTRGYTCQCYEGRYGDNCQARLCDYFTSDPCGPFGKCLGRIETGDMCTCPLKREGIFCEVNDYESVYGECPKRRRLIKYIMEILDGKTPTPYQLNMSVSHILRDINVSWLQMPNCTDRGTYSPVMMEFNVFNLTQKIYYCVNPYGNRLKYSYDSTQQPNCSAVVNGLCNSNPCRNEGVCHMSYDYNNESYWCECKPGFYGSTCEVSVCAGLEIDPCSLNSGVCLGDLETGKFCNCPAGRTGAFCDRSGDDSLLTTCQRLHELSVVAEQYLNGSLTISFFNVGQMIRDMTSKINMKTMWRPSCSETGKPLNVGCTVDVLNTTRKLCYCTDGHYQPLPNARPSYDGLPNCSRSNELNITTDMKPGMCPPVAPGTVGIGIQECNKDYDCRDNLKCCSNGFGYQCLHPVNQSHRNCSNFMSSCLNGGTCLRREGRYMCMCPVIYSGFRCEIRVQTACDNNPCKNGASCQAYPNGDYSCSCPSSWGKNCQYPSHDNCNCTFGNRCVLRERCQGDGYNYTNCFVRKECQDVNTYDPCGSRPCSENAECLINANGGHRCQCKEGFSGDNCYINKMICERSNISARCQMNDRYSECIGDVKNGLICKCSTTRSGIFCEIPYPQEQTRCEQRRAFYKIAFGPVTADSMMIRHLMNMTAMTSEMEVNCTSDGSFSPVQCVHNYDMYGNNKTRKCFCVDEQGRNKSSLVSYPGYPPCTAPNMTKDISQIICSYPIAMNLCWNNGRCLGDIFNGRICECAPGFSGIFCQRSGNSSVLPNSLCTLGREAFNLVTRINKGNFSWVSGGTIIEPGSIGLPEGVNVTNATAQITNMVLSSFGSMVSPLIDMIHSSYIPSPNCTQSGEFEPRQCEVNINNGNTGDCYCVFRNGTEQQGTRMRYPEMPYCHHLNNETGGCIPAVCGLQCRYGLRRNVKGCEICECRTPCEGFLCAPGSKCVTEETYICENTWSPCDRPVCKSVRKPGKCPNELVANVTYLINMYRNIYESCDTACTNDAECPNDFKCCPGCGMKCVKPLEKKTCLSHHKQVMHQIDLYKNLTVMLANSSISSQIQYKYPNMLDAGYHWMKNMTMLWKPRCSESGEYVREQCYYNMSGNSEPMKCFCVDDNGGMIDGTHGDVTNTTYSLFTCSEFKPGVCPTEGPVSTSCTQDYDCNGPEKCCGQACKLPSHKQPGRVNMTVPNLCDINVNLCNTIDLSAQCVGNWQDGHLCNCRQNGGPVCLAPQSSVIKTTACEKKRAVMELMKGGFSGQLQGIKASEYNLTIETLQRGLGDRYYNLSVMAATCKPNGMFDDIQCDVNIFTNQMERCYCVNSKGHRILGTESKATETPLCSNMCPIGEPMKNGTSYIRCGQGVPCSTGYSCNLQRIASANGDYYDEGYCCSNQTKPVPEDSCPAKPPRYGESTLCTDQCSQDRNCSSGRKCCMTSCGKKCILAREEQPIFRNEPCRPGLKPLQRSGQAISCGRGTQGLCPSGSYCDIAPNDSFAVCCPDEPIDVCSLQQDPGMCFAYIPRWFFNKENGRCEEFIYGGCGGNDNNFNSQEECCNSCGANGCKKDECPAVKNSFGTCVDMCRTDADCKGSELCCSNGCGRTCTIATKNASSTCFQELEKVALQMKSGQLSQCSSLFIPRCNIDGTWKSQQCWDSFGMCWCVLPNGTKVTQPTRGTAKCPTTAETRIIDQPVASNMQVCNGNESVHCCNPDLCKMTHCPANLHAVCRINPCGSCSVEFYHSNQKVDCTAGLSRCERHRYEALTARYQHGMNNMTNKPVPQLTDNTVNNTIHTFTSRDMLPVCQQPKVTGMCRAYFPRWYYNSTTYTCEKFVYGGCGGNDNNFETAEQCFHKCNQQMNPCKDVKCEVNEQCRIQLDNPNCFSGPCRLNGECIKVHPEPRMSGVFIPTCTENKDYQYRQCQDDYCWCVNRDGVMFDSSLTKEPLDCNETGPVTEVQAEVCPDNSSVANKECIDACKSKICPDHPDARCSVDLCSSNCTVKFVNRTGHEVTCGDDVCKVIQATPHKDCSTPVVCPGGGAPLLCPSDVCSSASCPGNPCAVCSVDPCRCKAVFTDIVTNETITDCQKVTTSSCRIDVCEAMTRKNRADLMGTALEYNWSPVCDDAGRYQTKQCNMTSCWCVDGSGRPTTDLQDASASCVRNETASVIVMMKFQQNFDQVSSKLSEFERAVLEMWNDMDLGKYVDSIEIRAGSVVVETTFKDKNADSSTTPDPILNMIPVVVENKIKNREAVLNWNGEVWVADDQYFESRRIFEAQTGGENPPEPSPKTEPPMDRNLIIVIVVACVVIVTVATGIVVWACCRKPRKEQYIEDTLDNVSSGSSKSNPQPPFGVSNQLYMTDKNQSISKLHFDEDFESDVVKYKL